MAEELGQLVYEIDAKNDRLKKSVAQSQRIMKQGADKMSASLGKVEKASLETSDGLGLLEKAAAATGQAWLGQVKAMIEFVIQSVKIRTALSATTAGYAAETAAINRNTAAKMANAGVGPGGRISRAIDPMADLLASGAGGAGGTAAVQSGIFAKATSAIGSFASAIGIATAGLAALAAGVIAFDRDLFGMKTSLTDWWYNVGEARETEARMEAELAKRQAAKASALDLLSRQIYVQRAGLVGGAAVNALGQGRVDADILRSQVELAELQLKQREEAERTANAKQAIAAAAAKERVETEKAIAAIRERGALMVSQKQWAIATGTASPEDMRKHAESLARQASAQQRGRDALVQALRATDLPGARLVLKSMGLIGGDGAASAPVPAMLPQGDATGRRWRELGMQAPVWGQGASGNQQTGEVLVRESKRQSSTLEQIERNTRGGGLRP